MTASIHIQRLSTKTALYIGLPCALLFSTGMVLLTIFMPLDVFQTLPPYHEIWVPSACGIILVIAFIHLISKGGKKIKDYLDHEYSIFKSAFLYISYVNLRICLLMGIMLAAVIFHDPMSITWNDSLYTQIGLAVALGILVYFTSTILITFAIGMPTILVAKIIITSAKADLSLIEYSM